MFGMVVGRIQPAKCKRKMKINIDFLQCEILHKILLLGTYMEMQNTFEFRFSHLFVLVGEVSYFHTQKLLNSL